MSQLNAQEIFQRNLDLINQIYPQYSSLLAEAAAQESRYTIEIVDNQYFTCKIESGEAEPLWIHGPDNPWRYAEKVIQESDWSRQRQFIIFRPSLGYFPFTLYPNMRKGRQAQRMLLVEDRIDLFVESIKRFDWTDVLRSDRTILVLNENPIEAVHEFVRINPVSILPITTVLCGCNENEEDVIRMKELKYVLTQLSETVNRASDEYLQELTLHYRQIEKDPTHKTKVLLVEPEHEYLAHSIAEGFQQAGCEVAQFNANQRMLNFLNPYLWLAYCRENYPDILMWMNRNTLSPEGANGLKDFPIKKVLWYLDNPKRVETSADELQATDYYFSFDPTYLDYLETLSGKKGHHLANAAGLDPLPECRPGQDWPERQGPDVGFVGALAASRFQEVKNYWLERDPEFVTILDDIVDAWLADPSTTLEERYEQSPGKERLPYSGFVVLYLEERATYLRRLNFLKAVKDEGLKTYGAPEWGNFEWAGELTSCFTGEAPQYREELPGVYYHTKININIFHAQCVNSSNPRVYDVLAAGGFLLTEHRPVLEDEFETGTHFDTFKTPDELLEKVRYYKQNPDERERMAKAGQAFVLENATYQHRVKTMMNLMKNE